MVVAALLAEVRTGTLLRSLLVALVLVSPFALRLWFRHRRPRSTPSPTGPAPAAGTDRPRLEDVIAAIAALAADRDGPPAGVRTVLVPSGVTVDGRDPPDGVVDLLVRDALRRSGLVATSEVDTPEGRVIECAPGRPPRGGRATMGP